jgi:hypothetical protein
MTTFQFDECSDDLEVIEACNAEHLAEARRLDPDLVEKKDPEILRVLMQRSTPLVTIDRALPAKHCDCIPDQNPGIIVVAYSRYIDRSRETLRTMTTRAAGRILRQFKQRVPEWHKLEVRNSIVEITNKAVEVSHVEQGRLKFDAYLDYEGDPDLQPSLIRALQQNLQR